MRKINSVLIGLILFTSFPGLCSILGKAYAEVQNVKVSGDVEMGKTDYSETLKTDSGEKQDTCSEISKIQAKFRKLQAFEYEGKTYPFNLDEKGIRENKAVFCTNFTKEGEYTLVRTKDSKDVPLNMEIFTLEIIDNITHFKRVTKTKDKHEISPIWTDDGNIAYVDLDVKNSDKLTYLDGRIQFKDAEAMYYIMNPEGNILREITSNEYIALKDKK